jgi:hypothetical protein
MLKIAGGVNADKPAAAWPTGKSGKTLGYTVYTDGVTTSPLDDYLASLNQTLIDAGGFVDYGGKPCSSDTDCEGVCPPDYKETCDGDGGIICTRGFTFDPPKK